MSKPPNFNNGVCIKVTPEVEKFLYSLDDCRNGLVQWKISQSKDVLTPGEQYTVKAPLGKGHDVILTCVGVLTPNPEIRVFSYEEIRVGRKITLRRIAAGGITTTLISMELLYYGSHNISAITNFATVVRQVLGW